MTDPKAAAAGDKPKTTTKLSATAGEFVPSVSYRTRSGSQTFKRDLWRQGGLRGNDFGCVRISNGADGDEQFERVYADLWHGIPPFDKWALGFYNVGCFFDTTIRPWPKRIGMGMFHPLAS